MKLQLKVAISAKTGRKYAVIGVDLGYTFKALSFNSQDIAEILGVSVRDLMERECGVYDLYDLYES